VCIPGKTSRSVTHPEIAPGQARFTPEFFEGGFLKKKVYLGGMSVLSILLSLESGCHREPLDGTSHHVLLQERWLTVGRALNNGAQTVSGEGEAQAAESVSDELETFEANGFTEGKNHRLVSARHQ
jgi:hypothetical protein